MKNYIGWNCNSIMMDEYRRRMQEFREHFGDLIDEDTLKLLVDYSFGKLPITKLSELANKKGKVFVEGVIEKVLSVREFIKDGKRGLVANAILKDEDARVRVTFWNDSAELVKTGDIAEGCRVKLRGFIKRRDDIELSVNDPSDVEILEDSREKIRGIVLATNGVRVALKHGNSVRVCLLKCRVNLKRGDVIEALGFGDEEFIVTELRVINHVKADFLNVFTPISKIIPLQKVNLRGRVSGLNGLRLVKGKDLAEIFISDETDRVKVLLWGEHAKLYKELDVGDLIEIYNAYPKIGWDGEMEVHCGRSSVLQKL